MRYSINQAFNVNNISSGLESWIQVRSRILDREINLDLINIQITKDNM